MSNKEEYERWLENPWTCGLLKYLKTREDWASDVLRSNCTCEASQLRVWVTQMSAFRETHNTINELTTLENYIKN